MRNTSTLGSAGSLRPIDVVSVEVANKLEAARKADKEIYGAYFKRAVAVEPVVDIMEAEINGHQTHLPLPFERTTGPSREPRRACPAPDPCRQ